MKNSSANKSNFVRDKKFEEASLEWLRTRSSILKDIGTKEIVHDRARQLKGIDLLCDMPRTIPKSVFKRKNRKVDIKAMAMIFPTFAFEISGNVSSGQVGWLVKEGLETDYYLIAYHRIENEGRSYYWNKVNFTIDGVVETRAILIKKEKLLKAINKEFDNPDFAEVVKEVRALSEDKKGICKYVLENGTIRKKEDDEKKLNMWITVSKQGNIPEQPVNIVIRRQILEKIAEKVWDVDSDGQPYIA